MPTTKTNCKKSLCGLVLFIVGLFWLQSCYANLTLDLAGEWSFKIGDNPAWSEPQWDDSDWETLTVPGGVRKQGEMFGFETIGWYRLKFEWSGPFPNDHSIALGQIHDADEVWLNGEKIGGEGLITTSNKIAYVTAYRKMRVYAIPDDLIRSGENVLAVRFRSQVMPGGIVKGPVGFGNTLNLVAAANKSHNKLFALEAGITAIYGLVLILLLVFFGFSINHNPELNWLLLLATSMFLMSMDFTWVYMAGLKTLISAYMVYTLFLLIPWIIFRYYGALGLVPNSRWIRYLEHLLLFTAIAASIQFLPPIIRIFALVIWGAVALTFPFFIFVKIWKVLWLRQSGIFLQLLALLSLYIFGLLSAYYFGMEWIDWRDAEIGLVLFLIFSMMSYLLRMKALQTHFQDLSSKVVTVADNERQSLARELHDGIGQQLAALKLRIGMAKSKSSAQQIEKAEKVLEVAVEDLQHLVKGLKPVALDNKSLVEAMRSDIDSIAELSDINMQRNIDNIHISDRVAHHLYRAFQECLHNAIRHSDAKTINISLERFGAAFRMEIDDDGNGFDVAALEPKEAGVGLLSLKERLSIVDGKIEVLSSIGKGARIIIEGPTQ